MTGPLVVKWGGGTGTDPAALCADIGELTSAGSRVVLVHGGSAEITVPAEQLGRSLRSLVAPDGVVTRYTDADTLDVITLALAGRVKPELVTCLGRHGVRALGMTGLDAGVVRARRKRTVRTVTDGRVMVVRDDRSGRIETVDAGLLNSLLDSGLVPVLSPPALAETGDPLNTNADRMAAAAAAALGSRRLVFLTGAPGVVQAEELLPHYRIPEVLPPWVTGGMAVKLIAAREALTRGVTEVTVSAGGADRPVRRVLEEQAGTRLALA
ncbi:acetylglutamate kinase [Amycolatopsis lurida]